jgi:shikimate kinase
MGVSEGIRGVTRPVVVFIGPPGAGKTTIAEAVARQRGLVARDTDTDVERNTGRTVAEIFIDDGEPAFRELEHEAVLRALAEHDGVLSIGGGAVLDPRTRDALRGHTVIFLDVRIADASKRIGLNRDRPLLLGNPRAQWTQMMDRRRPIYTEIATARVVTDGLTADEVTDQVLVVLDKLEQAGELSGGGERR